MEMMKHLTGEPEQIKAFRDTWELGIHSYLSYLRDRLLIAKELLTESGSCFVQIGDENVHLVRSLMDEVFGSENFVSQIVLKTTSGLGTNNLKGICDYIIWYSRNKTSLKYRQLYKNKILGEEGATGFQYLLKKDGTVRKLTNREISGEDKIEIESKIFSLGDLSSSGATESCIYDFNFNGKVYKPTKGKSWKTNELGMSKLAEKKRIYFRENSMNYIRYYDDFPVFEIDNIWSDTGGATDKKYIVQTTEKAIQRCLLMTSDPGDLVLDPTCGSGTSAYVAEQWGRRWITIDTSRIALNIAKQRLMTAVFPYYNLYDEQGSDIRQGFKYKTVPHVTLKSLANDEPAATESLYDQPEQDKKLLRVSGPFTVETLQNFEPISPSELDDEVRVNEEEGAFEEVIKQHLVSAGIKNGRKDEMVIFRSVELLASETLHAEGFFMNGVGEKKTYFHIGPKFGTVSKKQVNDAIKECRQRGDANWLVILGFSFESDIEGSTQSTSMGNFEVTKCRIHDDLLQEGLKKKPAKSAASFVTIGEPDIDIVPVIASEPNVIASKATVIASEAKQSKVQVEIKGLDIYDPIKDEVKPRNVHDIAYWMIDDDYDGSNFIVKQVFFCGGDKDEFAKWKKGLDNLAKDSTKKKVEKTLKVEIDDDAFDRLYGHISHPIEINRERTKNRSPHHQSVRRRVY
jgi:adenine-specific DNA-methyltransferase